VNPFDTFLLSYKFVSYVLATTTILDVF